MATNNTTITKTMDNYITKTYIDDTFENIKIDDSKKEDIFEEPKVEDRPVDTNNLLVKTCQGCIEGQPNQEAHMNWGGCLSIYDERTEVEQEEPAEDYESDGYCSTTSYETDGENATNSRTVAVEETEVPEIYLRELTTSSILTRRAANTN